MPAGSRRPSLEQLITTHQSTLETIIKTPTRQQGADPTSAAMAAAPASDMCEMDMRAKAS